MQTLNLLFTASYYVVIALFFVLLFVITLKTDKND